MTGLTTYALIAAGSAAGGALRFFVSQKVEAAALSSFPSGTLAVNVLGAFGIGLMYRFWCLDESIESERLALRALFMTGFCGGFTTFSTFSVQTMELLKQQQFAQAVGNIALSVGLCLAAVWLGAYAAPRL